MSVAREHTPEPLLARHGVHRQVGARHMCQHASHDASTCVHTSTNNGASGGMRADGRAQTKRIKDTAHRDEGRGQTMHFAVEDRQIKLAHSILHVLHADTIHEEAPPALLLQLLRPECEVSEVRASTALHLPRQLAV